MDLNMHRDKKPARLIAVRKRSFKPRLHTVINWANFVSWCVLYMYEGNKMHS